MRHAARANRHQPQALEEGITAAFLFQVFIWAIVVGFVVFWFTPVAQATWRVYTMSPEELGKIERSVHYPGCDQARAAGAAPIHRGMPGYRLGMDGDGDGIACEPYS